MMTKKPPHVRSKTSEIDLYKKWQEHIPDEQYDEYMRELIEHPPLRLILLVIAWALGVYFLTH